MLRSVSLVVAAAVLAIATGCANDRDEAGSAPATSPAPSASAPVTTSAPATSVASTTTIPPPVDLFALEPPPAATDPAALEQQVAYRQLGAHPEWDAAVDTALPTGLRDTARRHAAARREFRGMHSKLSSTLPAWRIVAPAPAEELMSSYLAAEAELGVPWRYLAAINLVETGMGRIRGTSIAGAQGPMQFMPATWDAYGGGGDINDTHDAIFGAARYLAANGGAADIDNALWNYNHSQRYVRGVKLYAELMAEHPGAFGAFYHWGVWYLSDQGEVYLPVGYDEPAPVPVADYLAR